MDPGRSKCGVAVVSGSGVAARAIVEPHDLAQVVSEFASTYNAAAVVVGNRTGCTDALVALREATGETPVVCVEEHMSTLLARRRYWRENPPGCLLRLLPTGMRLPPEPIDDWAAVILGERYLHLQQRVQGDQP